MEARVAVLEQIAKDTKDVLTRMDTRMDRMEDRMARTEDRMASDFKWLFGLGLGATGFIVVVMAHGFRWF